MFLMDNQLKERNTNMSLQEKLDAFKATFKTQAPAEAFKAFGRSTQELIDSGQAERALSSGLEQNPYWKPSNPRWVLFQT